jgi:hypothetical protein
MEHDDQHQVERMLDQRAEQIAEERAADGTGRALAEDVARVTAASRRLGADQPPEPPDPRPSPA